MIRSRRKARGWTLAELGARTGYSASQVSRYERGVSALFDVDVLRRFADALDIPPKEFGLTATAPTAQIRHGSLVAAVLPYPRLLGPRLGRTQREDGDDAVRRRKFLALTAAASAGVSLSATGAAAQDVPLGQILVGRLRDAMLGIGQDDPLPDLEQLPVELARVQADFHTCHYADLAVRLPRLIRAGHALGPDAEMDHLALLGQSYLLATRMLIKLDDGQQLGWMAADRARQVAEAAGHPLAVAEAARNLAVLARRAGWEDQALSIALNAADDPGLRASRSGAAERGLLIQSAAYSAARRGDREGMRELTDEAAAIAKDLGGATALRDHGGGFSTATVQLHRISAEFSTGDPSAALAAARALPPQSLPSVERRARYYTDVAAALAQRGRRDECVRALLRAEHQAPQETHSRPAVRSLISGLLLSGRTTPELRALAARAGALP
ncbi:helix-turn-helix domain-containing protein [Streptomyces sp. NPDC048638]|uniref:helix-turn-helix domain-containing protein n=1 Tax=Streptomyces sp. NPDC048638 TaxID=3365580 RepID=UPI00371AF917